MNKECGIVRDLLPLYAENIASPESVEFVEEHLKNCEACTEEYERVEEPASVQVDANTVPLLKLRQKMRTKRVQTAAVTVLLVITLLISAYAFLTAPIYFPYSADLVTVTANEDNTANYTFHEKVTHYSVDLYHDRFIEGFNRYEMVAWTTLWDKWFPYKEVPLWFDEGYLSPVYYLSNNGEEDVCIYGEPLDIDVSSVTLPRLVLGYYLIGAAILFVVLLLLRLIFKKKEKAKLWLERIMLYPISYCIAHLLVSGFNLVTYSLTRDFSLMILISVLLWCCMLFAHNAFKNRREIKELSQEIEEQE